MSPNDSLAGSSIIVPVAHVCRVVPRDGDGACAVGACGCEPAGVPNGGGRRLGSERSCTAGAVIRGLVGAGAANRGGRSRRSFYLRLRGMGGFFGPKRAVSPPHPQLLFRPQIR